MLKELIKKLFGEPTDFRTLLNNGAVIIDVRSPQEFASGHISGSKNIPLEQVKSKLSELKKMNKTIITVCHSGGRSSMAKASMGAAGIKVYNGGGWRSLQSKI